MSSKKKPTPEEYKARVAQAIQLMETIVNDRLTPRNIRRVVSEGIELLKSEKLSLAARAVQVIESLDEIMQDPNMPLYARTKLWQIISYLEGIRD
ncbi:MAG: UPF0147 family protein [Candidatus Bathyarchaeia archaeon]